jgi:AraC-like DNA-binding protein
MEASELDRDYRRYVFDNTDNEVSRLTYENEKTRFALVRSGDVEGVKAMRDADRKWPEMLDLIGRVAEKPFKQMEYMIAAQITLATRAAMEGGLPPREAYDLSDILLQRLEKCRTLQEIQDIAAGVNLLFARKVREQQEARSRSSHVERTKAFIEHNLNRPFSLDELAREVAVSKPYLERLFKTETGSGIMEYAYRKRVEAAASLLKYSRQSIADIAEYLCFSGQSHLGRLFREERGMTPGQYRRKEQVID